MAFRTATLRRAGAGILGTLTILIAAALATGQPGPVLAATPVQDVTQAVGLAAPGTNLLLWHPGISENRQILAGWPRQSLRRRAGGTAKLVQQTSVTPNARYDITGWLGGTKTSSAELAVQFMDSSGRILGTAAIGPAGKQAKPVLDYRQSAGSVPAGATRARVTITLTSPAISTSSSSTSRMRIITRSLATPSRRRT